MKLNMETDNAVRSGILYLFRDMIYIKVNARSF